MKTNQFSINNRSDSMRRCLFPGSALALFLMITSLSFLCPVAPAEDTVLPLGKAVTTHDPKMLWWRQAKFGMFIHWGLYAEAGGSYPGYPATRGNKAKYAEWLMSDAMVPIPQYASLADKFNPTAFDADAIVSLAKEAGMKYIVITAKHHDGFAMYHSAVDPYNIYDATAFKRDPLAELNVACQKQGVKLGFYYSQDLDWHAPGGAVWNGTTKWDPAQQGDFGDYIHHKVVPQIKELLTNYQPAPALFWFDMPTADMTSVLAREILAPIKEHDGVLMNDRMGGGVSGDYGVSELMMERGGARGVWHGDTEACDSVNTTWGYSSTDHEWKSTSFLITYLINAVSQGGNFLLNVGPDSTGAIPQPAVDRLKAIGAWMKVNGESIYGAGPTPFGDEFGGHTNPDRPNDFVSKNDWRCTTLPGKLFIHLLKWPTDETFHLANPKQKVTAAYLLADPQHQPLTFSQDDSGVSIKLPQQAPDPIDSVLVLEVDPHSHIGPLPEIVGLKQTVKGGPNTLAQAGDYGGGGNDEQPVNAVDGNLDTKFYNQTVDNSQAPGIDSGFIYTPKKGPQVFTGFEFATANDAEGRDPASVTIEGSNDNDATEPTASGFTLLYEGNSGLETDPGRKAWGQKISFPNTTAYKSYRILITKARSDKPDAVQYSEVRFLPVPDN